MASKNFDEEAHVAEVENSMQAHDAYGDPGWANLFS